MRKDTKQRSTVIESGREPGLHPDLPFPPAPEAFLQWLENHRSEIITEWIDRLLKLSEAYRLRPREELLETVTNALNANLEVLSAGRLSLMDRFIDSITNLRLEAGFPLSDVQRAFELFRFIVLRMAKAEGLQELLSSSMEPINACLTYTIQRFSDHFQHMHQREILEHAQMLEKQISLRTAELAESERRYKTLVEEINDGYFVIRDGEIIFANQCFCRMHGAELGEVVGKHFLGFVSPECREMVREAYQNALNEGPVPSQLEYTRLGCPPEEAPTEIRSRVLDLGHGPVMIGICRDISARVAMEAKVREHERLAYVGQLTASLSHEIRNPLSSIKINLQLLSRRLDLDGYDQRRLEITVHEVSRLEGILRQLLDTARPLNINKAPVDLTALAQACVDLLEPEAVKKNVEIFQRHPGNLPFAHLDAGELEQAVINLLLNAIEAVPEGGIVKVWTKATRARPDRYVELGVRDNGPGIGPDLRPHLFTPFSTTKSNGTGLGLSNVKRIVEAHSGSVEVRSRKGRGATFVVKLPCRA
jgi:PAS domain S-box-containing protein